MQYYTINELSDALKLSRQAVYLAIVKGKLKAEKDGSFYIIADSEAKEWRRKRYNRQNMVIDGVEMFKNGYVDVKTAARIAKVSVQKIYYAIYRTPPLIEFQRIGSCFRISLDALNHYIKHLRVKRRLKMKS